MQSFLCILHSVQTSLSRTFTTASDTHRTRWQRDWCGSKWYAQSGHSDRQSARSQDDHHGSGSPLSVLRVHARRTAIQIPRPIQNTRTRVSVPTSNRCHTAESRESTKARGCPRKMREARSAFARSSSSSNAGTDLMMINRSPFVRNAVPHHDPMLVGLPCSAAWFRHAEPSLCRGYSSRPT